MSKAKTYGTLVVLALAFVAMAIYPVAANLVPTTFGFPVIVQNGSTSAFNQDTANATDFENINISFPVDIGGLHLGPTSANVGAGVGIGNGAGIGTDGTGIGTGGGSGTGEDSGLNLGVGVGAQVTGNILPFGPVNLAFPDISQTVDQTQSVTHTDFAQTNEYAEFAYPFVGVGGVSLPGFGFGF